MRSGGLGRLGSELRRLQLKGSCLLFRIGTLFLTALLIGFSLSQVVLPPHVVDVENFTIRVKVEDTIHCLGDEYDVVRNHNHAALVVLEEFTQPHNRIGVEVVGRFIENHGFGVTKQNACEFNPSALTAGERIEGLRQDTIR